MNATPIFQFSTKANTLASLTELLKFARVPILKIFNRDSWIFNPTSVTDQIQALFSGKLVAIRSSASNEDGIESSMAGVFKSLLNINTNDQDALKNAIQQIYTALPNDRKSQFFIQEMVSDVEMSGVIMTRDLLTGAPYYVINYDDESGRTDTVTSGTRINKSVCIFREVNHDEIIKSSRIKRILNAVKEIESICGTALDIEFALDQKGTFNLLQVRPLTTHRHRGSSAFEREIQHSLTHTRKFLSTRITTPENGLLGTKTLFGTMPDWNLAELLGQTPKPLALSIFRRLITQTTWREARAEVGYKNPHGKELMVPILGHPYVDVRASFNSFLPKDLDTNLAERLVDVWIDNLAAHPELHDKVEFSIIQSCFDFSFKHEFEVKTKQRFNSKERDLITTCLQNLTRSALDTSPKGILATSLQKLEVLRNRQVGRSLIINPASESEATTKAQALLEEGIEFGAKPFAIVARLAFIAESFLRSAVERTALSSEKAIAFRHSLKTVTTDFAKQLNSVKQGQKPDPFIQIFGHLRPGTFDIESPRFVDRIHQLLDGPQQSAPLSADPEKKIFELTHTESKMLQSLLLETVGTEITPEKLLTYISTAITGREFGKFVLSRNVSDTLEYLAAWGQLTGLNRSEIGLLSIESIEHLALGSHRPGVLSSAHFLIEQAELDHQLACSIRLPALLQDPDEIFVAALPRAQPNLFGKGVIRGPIHEIFPTDDWITSLENKIVCIQSADPGFDWIFSKGIKGLITQYGGSNSHMAIRCVEMNLPAAIGCGEQLYDRIIVAKAVELNFSENAVRPIDA